MWNGKDPNQNFGGEVKNSMAGKQGAMQNAPGKSGSKPPMDPQAMGAAGAQMGANMGMGGLPPVMMNAVKRFVGRPQY